MPPYRASHTRAIWSWKCCKCKENWSVYDEICIDMTCLHIPCDRCVKFASGYVTHQHSVPPAVPMDGEQKQKKLLAEAHPHEASSSKERPAVNDDKQKQDDGEGKGKAKEA
ncbi:hypothetical protein PG985_009340 [Apiospora marii]|uniref:Uncharacterized protein n=1 Tax=Apiospora marii TaxID=335849 RepID=A0ABR1RAZ6_9PEZI